MKYCPKCGYSFDSLSEEQKKEMRFCPECKFPVKQTGAASPTVKPESYDDSHYVQLLQEKKYIEAVAQYRIQSGAGLKEAKEYIDALAKQNNLTGGVVMPESRSRFWRYLIGALFLGLMIASAGIAVFPELGLITQPLFGGELQLHSSDLYTPAGQSGYTTGKSNSFHCNGEDVSFLVFFYAFIMYSLLLFIYFYLQRFVRNIIKDARG